MHFVAIIHEGCPKDINYDIAILFFKLYSWLIPVDSMQLDVYYV